jgi:hypothetical protein
MPTFGDDPPPVDVSPVSVGPGRYGRLSDGQANQAVVGC